MTILTPFILGIVAWSLLGKHIAGLSPSQSILLGVVSVLAPLIVLGILATLLMLIAGWPAHWRALLLGSASIGLVTLTVWGLAAIYDAPLWRMGLLLVVLPGSAVFITVVLGFVPFLCINYWPPNVRKRKEDQAEFERFCQRTLDDVRAELELRIKSDPKITQELPVVGASEQLCQLTPLARAFFEEFGRLEIQGHTTNLIIDPANLRLKKSSNETEERYHLELYERVELILTQDSDKAGLFEIPKGFITFPTIYHAVAYLLIQDSDMIDAD